MVEYKEAKKNARRVVSGARGELYDRLGTKESEKDINKMAEIHERKKCDLNQVKCIKDEANRLLVRRSRIDGGCTLIVYSTMGTRALCPSRMIPLMTQYAFRVEDPRA
jgi:hypothetical protein